MKARSILSEALRNVVSGSSKAVAMALAFILLCGTIGALDRAAIEGIFRDAEHFKASGGGTYIISADSGIDGSSCDSLGKMENSIGAGAIRRMPNVKVAALPVSGVAMHEVSAGFLRAIEPVSTFSASQPASDSRATGVLISKELSDLISAGNGAILRTSSGSFQVSSVFSYPQDGRERLLDNAILGVVRPVGVFDECWLTVVSYEPNITKILPAVIAARFSADGEVTIKQLNSRLGERFDGASRYATRPTRYAPSLAVLLTAIVAFAGVWSRRLALASDRYVGVRFGDQLAQLAIESLIWGATALLVLLALFRVTTGTGEHSYFIFYRMAEIGTFGVGGILIGSLVACLSVRQRQLFAYFKGR